jgi:hypothetical protein
VYQIVARIRRGWFGLLAAMLFSPSPPFLFFTHGIRPEGMFVLFMLLGAWIVVRRDDGPNERDSRVLGLCERVDAAGPLQRVLMPLLFLPVVWYYDRGRLTLRKVLAYSLQFTAVIQEAGRYMKSTKPAFRKAVHAAEMSEKAVGGELLYCLL